jgi:glycosyltransferase involved in cell wall biosynthesis
MHKVSVIIPNYNHELFLDKRLISVLNQKTHIDKIIILDDASEDSSLEIINKYRSDDTAIIINDENSGSVFKQWQKGLSMIDKDSLVWIAESDDSSDAFFLQELLPYFEDPDIVIAYSRSLDIDEKDEKIGLSYRELPWCNDSFVKQGTKEIFDHLYLQCTIPNVSAVLFRNSAIDDSFFAHNFSLCGDWYFYLRLLEKGKIAYLSKPLNFHRFHQGTMRNKSIKSLEILNERLLIVKEVRKRHGLNFYRYVSSAAFQIELFITETRISDLVGPLGKKMFVIIKKYGYFFWLVAIILLTKRVLKKSFSVGR